MDSLHLYLLSVSSLASFQGTEDRDNSKTVVWMVGRTEYPRFQRFTEVEINYWHYH